MAKKKAVKQSAKPIVRLAGRSAKKPTAVKHVFTDPIEAFAKYKAGKESQIQQLENELREAGKKFLNDNLKSFFKKHPTLTSYGWNQYTPHWNDGDICEFSASVDADSLQINGRDAYDKKRTPETAVIAKDIAYFLERVPDSSFQDVYGDGVEITVTPNNVTIDEYEHD